MSNNNRGGGGGGQQKTRWDAMSVRNYESQGQQKSQWTKVGAAFQNKDGSISIQLDALPLDGRLVLQIPMTREEKEARWGNKDRGGAPQQFGGQRQQQGQRQGGFGGQQRQGGGFDPGSRYRQQNQGQQQQAQQTPDGGYEELSDPGYDQGGEDAPPFG